MKINFAYPDTRKKSIVAYAYSSVKADCILLGRVLPAIEHGCSVSRTGFAEWTSGGFAPACEPLHPVPIDGLFSL